MEMGKKLLAAGQLADALSHFHAAVGKRRARQTRFHPEAWLSILTGTASTSFLFRWRSKELHGLLQQSYRVSGNGKVKVSSAGLE